MALESYGLGATFFVLAVFGDLLQLKSSFQITVRLFRVMGSK
jgi:hypothetical protein